MIQRRHYECIRSILFIFSRDPSCLYDPSSCRVYYYDRQFVFSRCYNQHYDTESDAESWIISFYNRFSSRSCGRDTVPWSTLFQTAKSQSHQRNLIICFAFWYSSYELSEFSYAFFLGIVFGCLLEATDSIFATITAHMIFNGSSILLTYAISKVSLFGVNNLDTANTVTISSIIASIPVALIGLILSIFLLVAIAYLNGRLGYIKTWFQKDIRQTWPKKRVTNISFWAAFIVCFLFSIMMEITSSFL